jgi:hypothetical protein
LIVIVVTPRTPAEPVIFSAVSEYSSSPLSPAMSIAPTIPTLPTKLSNTVFFEMDFLTLAGMAARNSPLKKRAHSILVQRLRDTVSRFIPRSHIDLFFMLLRQYKGAIIGYAALDFLIRRGGGPITIRGSQTSAPHPFSTLEVSLSPECSGLGDFQRFFSSIGFNGIEQQVPDPYRREAAAEVYEGTKVDELVDRFLSSAVSRLTPL